MQTSLNNTTITSNNKKGSRIEFINQIIAKRENNNDNLFKLKFQQFYRDRMQLNKIRKKDNHELHDQILRLYKNNQVVQQINLSISTNDIMLNQKFPKSSRTSAERKRPRSQLTHRNIINSPKNRRPILVDVLRISPKYINNRTTISSKNDIRSVRKKNIFLDALILQQDSQDLF